MSGNPTRYKRALVRLPASYLEINIRPSLWSFRKPPAPVEQHILKAVDMALRGGAEFPIKNGEGRSNETSSVSVSVVFCTAFSWNACGRRGTGTERVRTICGNWES